MFQRRTLLRSALAAPLASTLASVHAADSFPTKPITIFVAFGPGGAGDLVTRRVAQKMSENMGQAVVIENRPGAGASAAAVAVAHAKPDGYTLLLSGNGTAISSVLFKRLPYDLSRDFRHVSSIASFDLGMIVGANSQFKSVEAILAFGRRNPGKLSIGTSRIGSTQHLAAEMFKAMTRIDAVSVPYRTSGDMLAGLRSNDVQLAFEILPPILGQISSGTVDVLAVASASRFPGLPETPTLAESGVPGFDASSWAGISAPAKTPTAVVERLSNEIQRAVAAPEVRDSLQSMGYVASASTPEEMTRRITRDTAKWKSVIEAAGVPRQ